MWTAARGLEGTSVWKFLDLRNEGLAHLDDETVWGGLHDLVERAMALVAEHLGLPVARQMMSRGMDKDRKAGTEELLDEVDQCGGGAVHDSGG